MPTDEILSDSHKSVVMTIGRWLRLLTPFRIGMVAAFGAFLWIVFHESDSFNSCLLLLPLIVLLFLGDSLLRKLLQHPKDSVMIWFIEILLSAGVVLFLLSLEA